MIATYEFTFLLVAPFEYSVLVLGRGPGEQGCFLNPEDEDEDEDSCPSCVHTLGRSPGNT